jgi:hypothetical protein
MPSRTNPAAKLRARITFRRAIAGQVVSEAQLLGRPVRDDAGTRVRRVADVVVRWDIGAAHHSIVGVLVAVGRAVVRVSGDDVTLAQHEISKPACLLLVVLLSVKSPRDSGMSAPTTRA